MGRPALSLDERGPDSPRWVSIGLAVKGEENKLSEPREQYYVLCAEKDDADPPIALLHMREHGVGEALAVTVYTAPEGEVQQEHLERFARQNEGKAAVITPITLDELLDVMNREAPDLALLDGEEVSRLVFTARIQEEIEARAHSSGQSSPEG